MRHEICKSEISIGHPAIFSLRSAVDLRFFQNFEPKVDHVKVLIVGAMRVDGIRVLIDIAVFASIYLWCPL